MRRSGLRFPDRAPAADRPYSQALSDRTQGRNDWRCDAEVLMLEIGERPGHEKSACQQNNRKATCRTTSARCGKEDRSPVERFTPRRPPPAAHAMKATPAQSENDASKERNEECKAKHGQRGAGLNGHVFRLGKGEREHHVRPCVGYGQACGPPMRLSSTLSVSIWRMSLRRAAPRAMRTATSERRAVQRASRRLAMLAHAMSRTTAERIMSRRRPSPVCCCNL